MKIFRVAVIITIVSFIISCHKDTKHCYGFCSVSDLVDSISGSYRVLVTTENIYSSGELIDTLGYDTIEVVKKDIDSISILDRDLSFLYQQSLQESDFQFQDFNSLSADARFILRYNYDSLRFSYINDIAEGDELNFRGRKIFP